MPNALHAPRLAIALVAALMMAACSQSQVESTDHSAGDPGHASGEHG
ncbi:cytochrome c, partial [Xanthomonas oryzae pv. oryzae]